MYHEQSKTGLMQYVWPALRSGFASGHMLALVVHMGSEICTQLGRWVTHIFASAVRELLWDRKCWRSQLWEPDIKIFP